MIHTEVNLEVLAHIILKLPLKSAGISWSLELEGEIWNLNYLPLIE